jgi:exopolyphosphatase/guanosine-5'-triphosphate,3'-diphosphate pyrophosphatase
MRICVLDLGGMSFHLLHVRSVGNGQFVHLGNLRQATRLGKNTIQSGVIDAEGWRHAMDDLAVLCEEIRSLAPDRVVAVATSAVRAASNSHAFVAEVGDRFGLNIEVLDETQEAALCYRGAASELEGWRGPLAVVDLGGGSCEVAVGQGAMYQRSFSADIGVLPLREAFGITDIVSDVKADALAEVVRMSLRPASAMLAASAPERLVLASGTARAVHALARSVLGGALPPGQMTLMQARRVREFVTNRSSQEFLNHDVKVHRVDVIAIAVIAIETIMSQLSCLTAEFSNRGLREGVVLREMDGVSRLEAPEDSELACTSF